MKRNYHKPYFFLVLVFVMVGLSACDPVTRTIFFVTNNLDEEVTVHFIQNANVRNEPDSLLIPAGSRQEYTFYNNIGTEEYIKIEYFIQRYDSIYAVKKDGTYSKNFMNTDDWEFHILEERILSSEGQYTLQIEESDF